ncbi:ribitol-5-phosphate transferase FKTN-like isoform X1 [Bacillus rossius redtenbacheri]|uniref:ribitol-5-phosphate transferase FKTN-like isoform X1 n=1 Tax=Bacillus rossius redtenbacheri TaxID=93214 RepID=UPI002FDE3D53
MRVRKRSAIHLCLAGGLLLLIAQLALLCVLLRPTARPADFPAADVAALSNTSATLGLHLLLADTRVLPGACPLTFVALPRAGGTVKDDFVYAMQEKNFDIAVVYNVKPRELTTDIPPRSPIGYFLKRSALLQVVVFYEREGNYWWHGSIDSDPDAALKLKEFGLSIDSLDFMRTEGAYDKFESTVSLAFGIPVNVPKDSIQFLREKSSSQFIECNMTRAKEFHQLYGKNITQESIKFSHKAWKLLSRAKTILDKLNVRFWLSSGTCLGYYRQCSIIPHSKDVDIGIFITDFNEKILPEFIAHGFTLKHWFGKINDSLEMSFMNSGIKLDLFFFYEDGPWIWNGGTQARSGRKFRFLFPRFTLCWTEFLELKVRVPCETKAYVEANYGSDWFKPVSQWDWKSSPHNVQEDGAWPQHEWPQVIRVYA